MKRRMISSIILFAVTFVALLVFVGLYIDESRRTQETYYKQYTANLSHVSEDLDSYQNAEGDLDFRYTRLISDMSSADSFAFLLDRLGEDKKKTINELNACIMRYPEQMRTEDKMTELKKAVDDILAELDQGYEEAQALVDSVDKQGH
ncbi:MAG: hypothetical protein Q4A05_00075 [Ruminococcus sp.]|nr:hypothetical protein [Ruminococcus sp.]